MKHELRQFLEKEFQSYDDLKGLSERLKTSAAAIETMIAPDSHNDVNLAGVNKSAANLILSALFQGKPYESGEYKPQKSIGIPFYRESIFRANLETICRELEALKRYAGDKTTFETTLETEKKIYQRIAEAAEKLRYFLDKDKEARLKAYKKSPLFERNIFGTASYEVVVPKEITSTLRQIAIINDAVTALDKLAENVSEEFKPLSCDSELSDFRETVDEIKAKLKARKEKILTPVVKPEVSNAAAAIEKAAEMNKPEVEIWDKRREALIAMIDRIISRMEFAQSLKQPKNFLSGIATPEELKGQHDEALSRIQRIKDEKKATESGTPKQVKIDISQPISQLKKYNKHLNKMIELQKIVKIEAMNLPSTKQIPASRIGNYPDFFEDDVNELENIKNESKFHLKLISSQGRTTCDQTEAHNAITSIIKHLLKVSEILQKHIENGNI